MRRVALDIAPLRASHDLRLLLLGEFLTGLGTQAALVALPFQLYTQTGSAFLTGLLGAVELVPMITAGLWGGAIADRMDRRRLLLWVQIGLVACAGSLAAGALSGEPPVWLLYLLGGLLAGFGTVEGVTRTAIVPNLVAPEHLRGALALAFGLGTMTGVIGPGVGGLLIAAGGVEVAYLVDAGAAWPWPSPSGAWARSSRTASTRSTPASGARSPRGCASCAATRRSRAPSPSTSSR